MAGGQKGRNVYKVRVQKDGGGRVVYRVKARSSQEAAGQKRSKGRVVSAVKV